MDDQEQPSYLAKIGHELNTAFFKKDLDRCIHLLLHQSTLQDYEFSQETRAMILRRFSN